MWRQGDILIAAVQEIPRGSTRRPNCVLAEGELTGHSHRIDQPATAELFGMQRKTLPQCAGQGGPGRPPGTWTHHAPEGVLRRLASARVFARVDPRRQGLKTFPEGILHAIP